MRNMKRGQAGWLSKKVGLEAGAILGVQLSPPQRVFEEQSIARPEVGFVVAEPGVR